MRSVSGRRLKMLAQVPCVLALSSAAHADDKLYVRAGIGRVQPIVSSREMELSGVDGPASLAIENGPIAGSGADVSGATIPAIIVGYSVTPKWSIETILGLPLDVKFKATGTLATQSIAPMAEGNIPTGVPPLGTELGEAKAVPPVVTAVYHFKHVGPLAPYAGVGAAMIFAYDAKVTNPVLTEISMPTMKVDPAPGFVMQGGLDMRVWKRVHARLDVKFIAGMLASATVEGIVVRTPGLPAFDHAEVGTAKMSAWLNPLIVQFGIGVDL